MCNLAPQKIVLEKKRWIILICFSIFTFTNASAFTTYSPILGASTEYYNTSNNNIIWLANIWFVSYAIGGLPMLYFYSKNMKWTLIVFAFIQLVGGWVRYAADDSYQIAFLGVFIIAMSQLIILQAPVVLAERWFPSHERILATSLVFFINIQGLSYGSLSSAYYVGDDKTKIHAHLFIQAIVLSVPAFLCLVFMKNKPKYPANVASTTQHLSSVESIKLIFFHLRNLLDVLSLTLFLGLNWTFLTVLDLILSPHGYVPTDICWLSTVMNLAGLAGGIIPTVIIDKQLSKNKVPKYDLFIRMLSLISFATIIILAFILEFKPKVDKAVVYVLCAGIGLGFNAYVPVAAQSMMETFYPINENAGFTIFNVLANVLGFLGNLAGGLGMWMIAGLMLPLFLYLQFVYKTKLVRLDKEKEIIAKGKIQIEIAAQKYKEVE